MTVFKFVTKDSGALNLLSIGVAFIFMF